MRDYFTALHSGDGGRVWALTGPDWRAQYPAENRSQLLDHPQPVRILSAEETRESLAQPAEQRARRREYLVELEARGAHLGAWSPGRNARFVGLLRIAGGWRVDAIATAPGFLFCDGSGACRVPTASEG